MSSDESDGDISEVQEDLLKKLENYGNSVVGSYANKGKTKKSKKTSETKKAKKRPSHELPEETKKKKKPNTRVTSPKKSKIESQTDGDCSDRDDFDSESDWDSNSDSELDATVDEEAEKNEKEKKRQKQMEELKLKLGLTEKDFAQFAQSHKKEKKETTAVITAAGKPKREPEVVVFEDPAKRRERAHKELKQMPRRRVDKSTSEDDSGQLSFNMRDAKFDVYQFAVKGMAKEDRESAQMAHAIKLGAEPKKRTYMNYKVLMETKKKEKEQQKETSEMERNMGYKISSISSKTIVSSKANKRKGRRRPDNVLTKDGQIGRFREGIQFISGKQLDNVKTKSGRR